MDKSMLADMESLGEADKQRMSVMIDQLQIRDRFPLHCFLKNYFFCCLSLNVGSFIWFVQMFGRGLLFL